MTDGWAIGAFATQTVLLGSALWLAGGVLVWFFHDIAPRGRGLRVAWVLAAVAALLAVALRAGVLAGSVRGMVDPDMLGLLWQTPVGGALLRQVAGLGLIVPALIAPVPTARLLAGLGAGLLLSSFVTTGHVADVAEGQLSWLLALHLGVGAWWIGILAPLHRLALSDPARAATVGETFGRAAQVLVPAMIVAGGVMAWQVTGSFGALIGTSYGRVLLIKIALVAIVLGLAAMNKLRHVPRLRAGVRNAGPALARSIALEAAAIGAVVLLTAALSTLVSPTV